MTPPTHIEWQAQVTQLAAMNGWRWLHVRRSIGRGKKWVTSTNVIGWPDLLLWHERDRRVVAVELKVGRDTPTDEQREVLVSLSNAGVETHVWYPHDLDDAIVVLARRTTGR